MIESSQPPFCQTDVTSSAVYMEDCIIGMKRYPDKFFNLAIVDVPYTDNYDSMKQISVSNKGKAGDYHYNSLSNAKPTKEYRWVSTSDGIKWMDLFGNVKTSQELYTLFLNTKTKQHEHTNIKS